MTAVVGERSTDRLTRSFEEGSTDEDCGGEIQTSDEPTDEVAGEADKCAGPGIWGV